MDETEDLEASVRELSATLEELRSELREPPTGPLGLPRPPTPAELLRLTEQYTIPAVISVLETNIRLLELLAAALRVADGRPLDGAGSDALADAGRRSLSYVEEGREGLAAASRATLERLDDALADLQAAAEGGEPDDPEIQRLLARARDLRSEIDERLAAAESGAAAELDGEDEPTSTGEVGIDVDEELETLRRQAEGPDDGPDDGADSGNGD